jgi:hypothetical protein
MNILRCLLLAVPLAGGISASLDQSSQIDLGYRHMYNLDFAGARQIFADLERVWPTDPLIPVSNAAAYLFEEFDRLNILQAEFFTEDEQFRRADRLTADPVRRAAFYRELEKADRLAQAILARNPRDPDALFAAILRMGLIADYSALIEKRYAFAFKTTKEGRILAEKLVAMDADYADAYLAIGIENYMLSQKPAPVRWILRLSGGQTDKERGLQQLRLTAEKGRYLRPYARLLLAVAALRDQDRATARDILSDLARQFPRNHLYTEQLARIR